MTENLKPVESHKSHTSSPRRSRAKKKADPFDRIPQLSPSPSPHPAGRHERKHEEDDTPDSLFQKIVTGPLIFTSFVVSLFLVDRRDRAWRVRQHPATSFWSRFNLVNWLDPEPYQDPDDTTWKKDEGSADAANPIMDPPQQSTERTGWFRRKKHRRMAKYEFEDAFALRESVAAWIVGAGVLVVGGSAYVVKSWIGWNAW